MPAIVQSYNLLSFTKADEINQLRVSNWGIMISEWIGEVKRFQACERSL